MARIRVNKRKRKKPQFLTTSIQTAEDDPFCPTEDDRIRTTTVLSLSKPIRPELSKIICPLKAIKNRAFAPGFGF